MKLAPWPTLTETETRNATEYTVAEGFRYAVRYMETAERGRAKGGYEALRAREGCLKGAAECGRKALLMLDILLQADAAERKV